MHTNIVWEEFLKIAKEEAGSQVVETWFKAVTLETIDSRENSIALKMPNNFVRNWIQEHYHSLLTTHLKRLLNCSTLTIKYLDSHNNTTSTKKPEAKSSGHSFTPAILQTSSQMTPEENKKEYAITPHKSKYRSKKNALNPQYHFDSFVVGPSNSLAHGAAYAVSQNLGNVYNPLLIYGGTGLGKTHLLHAIGNAAREVNPQLRVKYETSDQFMHDFISSIRFDKAHQFRERYKNIDLLLIDDVQFFSNKEQTQETFFHIFNTLYEQKKQIVMSADMFPEEIKGLQGRLKSRMEWGLVADMQTPDLETKIAILNKKAELHNISLSQEVSHFIASRVHSNIRQLEGALIRVDAFASLTGQKITLELAQKVLINFQTQPKQSTLQLSDIGQKVAKYFATTMQELKSKKRSQQIAMARQVACYLMKKLTNESLQSIGDFLGGRDHSTIIHAINKIEQLIIDDLSIAQKIKTIKVDLTQD